MTFGQVFGALLLGLGFLCIGYVIGSIDQGEAARWLTRHLWKR